MKKIAAILLILVLVIPYFASAEEAGKGTVSSIIIDAETGQILYGNNTETEFYPGALSDIALLDLYSRNINSADIVTVSENAFNSVNPVFSSIGALKGEKFSAEALLNAINLISAEDAKYALSEALGVSKEEFNNLLNENIKKSGALSTDLSYIFSKTPEKSYSTVYDIANILKYAYKNEKFRKVYNNSSYKLPTTDLTFDERNLERRVKLFEKKEGQDYDVTGYTYDFNTYSKNSAAFYADNGKRKIICVITGCASFEKLESEAQKLAEYGFSGFVEFTLKKDKIPDLEEDLHLYKASEDVTFLLKADDKKSGFKYEYSKEGIKVFNDKGSLLAIAPVSVTKQFPVYIIIIRILLFSLLAIVILVLCLAFYGVRRHNLKKKARREKLKKIMSESENIQKEKEKV